MTSTSSRTYDSNVCNPAAYALGNLANCPVGQLSLVVNWRNQPSFVASPPQPWACFEDQQGAPVPGMSALNSTPTVEPEPTTVSAEPPKVEVVDNKTSTINETPVEINQPASTESTASDASTQILSEEAKTPELQPSATDVDAGQTQAEAVQPVASSNEPIPQPLAHSATVQPQTPSEPEPVVVTPTKPDSSIATQTAKVESVEPLNTKVSEAKLKHKTPKPEPMQPTLKAPEQIDAPETVSPKNSKPTPTSSTPSTSSRESSQKASSVSTPMNVTSDFETMNAFASFGTPLSTDDYIQQLEGLVLELNCELERLQLKESSDEIPATSLIFRRMINLSLQNRELKQQLKKQSS